MSGVPDRSCRRSGARWTVDGDEAWVEWESLDGSALRLRLRDVSPAGVSFIATEGTPRLEPGMVLPRVSVRVADCEVTAELVVMHVTPDPEVGAVCGAMVYPKDELHFARLLSRAKNTDGS